MHSVLWVLASVFVGCNDINLVPEEQDPNQGMVGSIAGRVCDASGRTWLGDALVYTNIHSPEGVVTDTRQAYTDRDGYWILEDLPGDEVYDVIVQRGVEILDRDQVYVAWGQEVLLEEPACFDPLEVNVAVVTGDYDDFQLVLSTMGFANYTLVDGQVGTEARDFFLDPEELAFYDILFVNGGAVEEDVLYDTDGSDVAGLSAQVRANLAAYVDGGGALYASDWSYDFVEQVWPDRVNFVGDNTVPDAAQVGEYDYVHAAVSDAALASFLEQDFVDVEYDLPVWAPIQSVAGSVSVHLTGQVDYRVGSSSGSIPTSPLLVSFTAGQGKVVYSTFRVAQNASDDMLMTLQYMMYAL